MKPTIIFIATLLQTFMSLAQQDTKYFALIYTTGANWDPSLPPSGQAYFKEHSKHLKDLREAGKIAIGARYSDKGLIVLKLSGEVEAEQILAQDPSVIHQTFKAEIHPFNAFYEGEIKHRKTSKTMTHKTAVQNFQIPVIDFERAHQFYSKLMGYDMQKMEYGDAQLAMFQFDPSSGIGGNLIKSEGLTPSSTGTMVYLYADDDLQPYLDRVNQYGGKVVNPKTLIGPDMGYFAIFDDPEGNRVGLYSKK